MKRKTSFLRQLLGLLRPFGKSMGLLVVLYTLQTLCSLFMPYFMSSIVEGGIRNADMRYVLVSSGIMCGLAVLCLALSLVINRISTRLTARFTVYLRRRLFEKVNSLSAEQFSAIGTGGLITRTTEDASWLEDTVGMIPMVLGGVPILFFGGVVLSFTVDRILPLIIIAVTIPALAFTIAIVSKMDGLWEKSEKYVDEQNRIMRERFSGVRVIRAFDKERYEHERTKKATFNMCKSFIKANVLGGMIQPVADLLLNLATVAVIYVGAIRLETSTTLRVGDVVAVVQYISLIITAILTVSWTISLIPHDKICLRRIYEILDMPEDPDECRSDGKTLGGAVSLKNVTFCYPGAQAAAVKNVNMEISDGETVAIIGGIGSGKTTLTKLILDFYKPSEGTLSLGGEDYGGLTSGTVRDNVAIALQKSMIFECSVKDNVKMGNKDATDGEVEEALAVAQMSDFIASQPDGVDYMLKQSGTNISGGQKQRINIARTMLKKASVYIFDDSFSALDYMTESNLRRALNGYLRGKTQIIVTQRAATAMRCDKVFVMDGGAVVGNGTHAELLVSCPVYREIYDSQLGGDGNE